MGARPEDYERASPEHSHIHVDDFEGPKELAEFLHKLDQDDDLYNEYFQWKVSRQRMTRVERVVVVNDWQMFTREDKWEWQKLNQQVN